MWCISLSPLIILVAFLLHTVGLEDGYVILQMIIIIINSSWLWTSFFLFQDFFTRERERMVEKLLCHQEKILTLAESWSPDDDDQEKRMKFCEIRFFLNQLVLSIWNSWRRRRRSCQSTVLTVVTQSSSWGQTERIFTDSGFCLNLISLLNGKEGKQQNQLQHSAVAAFDSATHNEKNGTPVGRKNLSRFCDFWLYSCIPWTWISQGKVHIGE